MKFLYKWTLTYNIIFAFICIYDYLVDYSRVNKAFHGEAFMTIIRKYLKMNPKIDWLGRVYGVVNPAINEKGQFDFNGMIFEIDGINTNNNTWVENWLYKQMTLVNNVYGLDNTGFFDIIGAETRHVGPINADNFLIVFDIVSRKIMCKQLRRVFWQTLLYVMIIFGIYQFII